MNPILKRLFKLRPRKPDYSFEFVEELPEKIKGKRIYICTHAEYPWQINFLCPCGCNVLLYLNLLEEVRPCWSFKISKKKKISLHPSINRKTDCRSHFFVRQGKIEWV